MDKGGCNTFKHALPMKYLFVAVLGVFISSCDSSRIYEDFNDMEEAFWHMDSIQTFQFQIEDIAQAVNIHATFRNTSGYPYYNIYFEYSILDSLQNELSGGLKEYIFFDPKTGEPFGSGLGDLFDHKVVLEENFEFRSEGQYLIELRQMMRMDTLPYILSVGARVERTE